MTSMPLQLHPHENAGPGSVWSCHDTFPQSSAWRPHDPSRATAAPAPRGASPETEACPSSENPQHLEQLCWGTLPLHATLCVFILLTGVSLGRGACLTPRMHPWGLALSSHKSRHMNLNPSRYSVGKKNHSFKIVQICIEHPPCTNLHDRRVT